MVDLHNNQNLGYIIHHFHRHGKPTALICHGPVALLSTNLAIPMGSFSLHMLCCCWLTSFC